MYNELEYNLTELDLPNIVLATRKADTVPEKAIAHPFLKPLLLKLAKARPKWTLVGTRYTVRDEGAHWITAFEVFEGNTSLGTVTKSYNCSASCDCFAIDNTRMSSKRQRGNATTTKDVTKAFKIITREFHGKTINELVVEARQAAASIVSSTANHRRSEYQNRVNRMSEACLAFAVDHWDAFAQFAREKGVAGVTLDTFHEARQQYEEGNALYGSFNTEEGRLVVLRGDEYIIRTNDETVILKSSELTPHLRTGVGLLKLADKGTFIPGIGVKVGAEAMFVMPEPKGDETSE